MTTDQAKAFVNFIEDLIGLASQFPSPENMRRITDTEEKMIELLSEPEPKGPICVPEFAVG